MFPNYGRQWRSNTVMFPNHGQEIKILQSHVPNLWTVLGCTIPDATPPQPIIGSKVMEM